MMMGWMDRRSDGENKSFFLLFLKCFDFFGFWNFYDFFGFLGLRCKSKQENMYKESVFQTLKNAKHTNNPIRLSTRTNKAYLRGVLDIHKVREAQICR